MLTYITAIIEAFRLIFGGSSEVWPVIVLSLSVSGLSVLIATVLGVPFGYFLGISRFSGRAFLIIFVNTAMGFPPVVIGLFVYMALSRTGPLGFLELLYTPPAMVIAQVILATPLVAGVTTAAIASLGASRLQEGLAVLKEARRGVVAAVIAGFGGIISEVGAVMMVGGNIEGSTTVMTTAIMANVRRGENGQAMAWAMVLLGITLMVNVALTTMQNVGVQYER
jgi:tungstate transport system permease protein